MKVKSESEVAQSCPTLRDPMDCSPPGSSAHGIFQARVLEWGAISSSYLSPNELRVVRVSVLKCYCVSLTKPLIVLCFPSAGCFKNILLSLTSCKCMENIACKINHKSPFFPPLLFSFETFRVRCICCIWVSQVV